MIRLSPSSGITGNKVTFTPRPGTVRGAKEAERDLVYGFRCEFCGNVIALAFLTQEKLTLGRYEESLVITREREIREIIPNRDSTHSTAYEIDWMPIHGKQTGIQHVFMRNHVLRAKNVGERDPFEKGARCCPYTGVLSLRRDLLIKDSILMAGFSNEELDKYQLPEWEQFISVVDEDPCLSFIHAVGSAPPMIMCLMDWIKEGQARSHWDKKLLRRETPVEKE